jgi:ABC-type polysaccharide/polyol phosphate export permease
MRLFLAELVKTLGDPEVWTICLLLLLLLLLFNVNSISCTLNTRYRPLTNITYEVYEEHSDYLQCNQWC